MNKLTKLTFILMLAFATNAAWAQSSTSKPQTKDIWGHKTNIENITKDTDKDGIINLFDSNDKNSNQNIFDKKNTFIFPTLPELPHLKKDRTIDRRFK